MTGPEVLDVSRDAIFTLVVVSSPVMLVGLAVGLAISLLQALTQIQEMTLDFRTKNTRDLHFTDRRASVYG
jgi:flagellar biosynthetic protein FliQ